MKTLLKFSLLSILAIIGFTSCEDEGTGVGGTTATPPTVELLDDAGFVSFSESVTSGQSFSVRMNAEQGDSLLNTLSVLEDGVTVDLTRLTVDGIAASSNPILLFNDDKLGFTKDIEVVAQTGESTNNYEFVVTDESNLTASSSVSITTENVVDPPTILVEGSGMAMVTPGTIFGLPVDVSNVTSPLTTIAVLQDGVYIDADRLWYDDTNVQFPTNPAQLPQSDINGFMKTIFVRVHADAGVKTYTIELTDESGGTYTKDVTLETGTSVMVLDGVLFNRAGPAGTGGLNLENGMGVGSSDPDATIKDEGIDGSPLASNWIRRISGANGAMMKHIFTGQGGLPDDFDFDNVTTSQQVASLWDNGVSFVDTNTDGDPVSLRVEQGDVFTVSANNKFYLIRVSQINETVDNNADNYVIDIRF